MKEIKLTQGRIALVDEEDFEYINQFKWCVNSHGYALRGVYQKQNKKIKHIFMHRMINNTPIGMQTDHINHNKLDNRKENLRIVTGRQNCHNRIYQSGLPVGVTKCGKKFRSQIYINGKQKYIGLFDTELDAHIAYKDVILKCSY